MSPELRLRILSGVVLGAIVLGATFVGGLPFRILAVAIGLLIHFEFTRIIKAAATDPLANAIAWVAVAATSAFILFDMAKPAFTAILAGVAAVMLLAALRGRSHWSATALGYAGLSALALSEIRGEGTGGLFAMLFVFAVVWATDILAYFCGRALGGAKLAPSISPGKTWSGALFGAGAGVAAGLAVALAVVPGGTLTVPVIALLLSVASQCGDLFESWVKRRFSVKDSSHLIPGHGGVMDRVDGLVFAAFAAIVIVVLWPHLGIDTKGGALAALLFGG